MKIAFVSQGHGKIDPPVVAGSISIWTFEVLNELKKSHAIIAYEMDGAAVCSRLTYHDKVALIYVPTLYNRVGNRLHAIGCRVLKSIFKTVNHRQKPNFSSGFSQPGIHTVCCLASSRAGLRSGSRPSVFSIHTDNSFFQPRYENRPAHELRMGEPAGQKDDWQTDRKSRSCSRLQ